jgi:hypothetical protein
VASVLGRAIVLTAATTTQVNLCVGILPMQQSRERGQAAQWAVGAWTTGGNVPDAKIRLQATPASAGTPRFTFGCGSDDGTSTCDLGAVDATSAQRELQAQVTVPVTASTVTSVSLTVTGSAANLRTDPAAAAAIALIAPPTPVGASLTLTAGTVPGVSAPALTPTLSAGGNAAGLFPTLAPQSPDPSSAGTASTRQVANTSALPVGSSAGSSTLGAQVAGLVALALAGVFAVTRISIRRPAPAAAAATSAAPPPPEAQDEPAEKPDSTEKPDQTAEPDSIGEPEAEGPADPPATQEK